MKQQDWYIEQPDGTAYERGSEEIKAQYLRTPEHFRRTMEFQILKAKQTKREKPVYAGLYAKAAAVLLAVTVCGGAAYASAHFHLMDIFGEQSFSDPEAAASHIQIVESADQTTSDGVPKALSGFDRPNSQETFDEPLMTIREAYYDGATVFIYAVATQDGEAYDFYTDGIMVNGVRRACNFGPLGSGAPQYRDSMTQYRVEIPLADQGLSGDLLVEIPLDVFKKGVDPDWENLVGSQTVTLNIPVSTDLMWVIDDQMIELDSGAGYVELLDAQFTPSQSYFRCIWHLKGEKGQILAEKLTPGQMCMGYEDPEGTFYNMAVCGGNLMEARPDKPVWQGADGSWCVEASFSFVGPVDADYLVIRPYVFDESRELQQGEMIGEAAFTIDLTAKHHQ